MFMKFKILVRALVILLILISNSGYSQRVIEYDNLHFEFEGNTRSRNLVFKGEEYTFDKGIEGQALTLQLSDSYNYLELNDLFLDGSSSFTVHFWIKSNSENPTVLLSQKQFSRKGVTSQKNAGWVLYTSGGTFAWSIGSGTRRLNYERENGQLMPLNDGLWHHISMTYNKEKSEVRLYYDGINRAVFRVGFDFINDNPLVIGCKKNKIEVESNLLPEIELGRKHLQALVDEFHSLNIGKVNQNEFLSLISNPKGLYKRKLNIDEEEIENSSALDIVDEIRKSLNENPYTVHQIKELTQLKPVSKIYSLIDGKVIIDPFYSNKYAMHEKLYPSNFSIDKLSIFSKVLSEEEIFKTYSQYKSTESINLVENLDTLIVAVWNIWHGGKHFTIEDNDWDSRHRIAEIIKENNIDVVLMQETYSSGDYIAAELGYYFATTADWDYRLQGSNISVLSRYPINRLNVPEGAEFMNVAAKIRLSKTQEIYAMSNWYGMSSFPIVYDFHKPRFDQSDEIPVLFGGDFNAVPHLDGGDSPASIRLIENGFKDAYRNIHPDTNDFPGYTHNWGERIDQLYYKGRGLENISTEVIHTWFGGFPSDHFMILSKFVLDY